MLQRIDIPSAALPDNTGLTFVMDRLIIVYFQHEKDHIGFYLPALINPYVCIEIF
jgi:hypothetical protein